MQRTVTSLLLVLPVAAVLLAASVLPVVAARAAEELASGRVTIEGQVFDANGRPLAGVHVAVFEKGTGSPFDLLRRDLAAREVVSRPTDRHGLFRIDLQLPDASGRLLVRCYDEARWDHLRYDVPGDIDVTPDLRRRGRAIVTCRVDDAPVWRELAHRIERVGGLSSERGRILRAHGLPAETLTASDGSIEWRYDAVSYVFEGETLVRTEERPQDAADGRAAR